MSTLLAPLLVNVNYPFSVPTALNGYEPVNFSAIQQVDLRPNSKGAISRNQPISVVSRSATGSKLHSFSDDWYYRIHILPVELNVGNMLATYSGSVQVWNAHLTPQTLYSVTGVNDANVEINVGTLPDPYRPLEVKTYGVTVLADGDPTISATYSFDFSVEARNFYITGKRSILWPYIPQAGFSEGLRWQTAVIESYTDEKRHALMSAPRQSFDYTSFLTPRDYTMAKITTSGWSQRVFGVPVWGEYVFVGDIVQGATVLALDTSNADWRVGGSVFIWVSNELNTASAIAEIHPDRLVLTNPLTADYFGAYVTPMRFGYALDGFTFNRTASAHSAVQVKFTSFEGIDLGANTYPLLKGRPVMIEPNLDAGGVAEKVYSSLDVLDTGYGEVVVDVSSDLLQHKLPLTIEVKGRAAKWALRRFLHSLRGRQKTFWLPSQNSDAQIVSRVFTGDYGVVVSEIGYHRFNRTRGLLIELNNGTRLYNQILSSTTNNDGTEVLNLYQTVGATFEVADVKRVSFMTHVRLDTDEIDIEYSSSEIMRLSTTVAEVPE